MIHELYLQPPALGEFLCAGPTAKDVNQAISEIARSSKINDYKMRFTVPNGVTSENLGSILTGLQHKNLKGFSSVRDTFYKLTPETTLTRNYADCKARAILAVTVLRKHNLPVRFFLSSKDHVVVEEFINGGWFRFDPGNGYVIETASNTTPKFNQAYENMLELLQN